MSRKEKIQSEALEFNIKKFLECTKEIKNFNELNRAWAWYDCQNAFNNNHKLTPAEIDYRAKELFIYLANWGMVARGSFIMKHTWRILKEVVTEISRKEYNDLRKITISETEKDSHINTINSLYEEIAQILYKYHEDYKPDDSVQEKKDKSVLKVSSALITKILLGTTGCIVAYDSNVRNALSMFSNLDNNPEIRGAGGLRGKSDYRKDRFTDIYDFYFSYKDSFNKKIEKINQDSTHPKWTVMKLIDYCLWNYWDTYGAKYEEIKKRISLS